MQGNATSLQGKYRRNARECNRIARETQAKCKGMLPDCKGNATEIQGKRKGNEEARPASRLLRTRPKSRILPRFIDLQSSDTPRSASRLLLRRITLETKQHTTARKQTSSPKRHAFHLQPPMYILHTSDLQLTYSTTYHLQPTI